MFHTSDQLQTQLRRSSEPFRSQIPRSILKKCTAQEEPMTRRTFEQNKRGRTKTTGTPKHKRLLLAQIAFTLEVVSAGPVLPKQCVQSPHHSSFPEIVSPQVVLKFGRADVQNGNTLLQLVVGLNSVNAELKLEFLGKVFEHMLPQPDDGQTSEELQDTRKTQFPCAHLVLRFTEIP